jgi:putative DNA primase/helicase
MLKLESALPWIPAESRDVWLKVGMALKWSLGDDGFSLWDEWSQSTTAANYAPEHQEYHWNSFAEFGDLRSHDDNTVDLGTVYHIAKERGWPVLRDFVLQAKLREMQVEEFRKSVVAVSGLEWPPLEAQEPKKTWSCGRMPCRCGAGAR